VESGVSAGTMGDKIERDQRTISSVLEGMGMSLYGSSAQGASEGLVVMFIDVVLDSVGNTMKPSL